MKSLFLLFLMAISLMPVSELTNKSNEANKSTNPDPAKADTAGLLINPCLSLINGNVPGWNFSRNKRSYASFATDGQALVIENLFYDGIYQRVNLTLGHYMLRTQVKTNVFPIALYVNAPSNRFRFPLGISEDFRWVELPFYVTSQDKQKSNQIEVGIRFMGHPGGTGEAARQTAKLSIKKMELIRLGDTELPYGWESAFPAHLLHGLEAINNDPEWERPGKVIFRDSFLGTELWMMTQGGQTDMSYAGLPDFSHDGKYIQTGHRRPGYVMRTDGTYRYKPADNSESWTWKILWPFPWEEKRIPAGTDPSDWIATSRDISSIEMLNLATGKTHQIKLPARPGLHIIHFPSATMHAGRGPDIRSINYETLVWQSEDQKSIGLSDTEGENFKSFKVKSISSKPENDKVYPSGPKDEPMSFVGGKGGDNWRNAVDRNGNRYFLFELNRDNDSSEPSNPYQVWAICLSPGDNRGLLKVVPKPDLPNLKPDTTKYLLTWWEYAALFPWSGDNAIFLLEDGTFLHMSSLGMHSGFGGTISTQDPYNNEVTFIANYPKNSGSADRISWPHEFKHNRDFAILEANTDAAPYGPLVMIDLKHNTLWTLVLTNYYDYAKRYQQRPMYKGRPGFGEYHKPMFRHCPTPSPDFTKVCYCSSMLTGDDPARMWGDCYIAVARYPQPPVNVRMEGNSLVWDKPYYNREIKGFNIYRSDESGSGRWKRINLQSVKETRYSLSAQRNGFYVLTSVEHSELESRDFSNEVSIGDNKVYRLFYQAEDGELTRPMEPVFEPKAAANSYAVAVTDPELIYKKRLGEGLKGSVKLEIDIPFGGKWRIITRVRGMFPIERSTYTTGWAPLGEAGKGSFEVYTNGKVAGKIKVAEHKWMWVELDKGSIDLPTGKKTLEFTTSNTGIAIDNILVTNDISFVPRNLDNTPEIAPSVPANPGIEELKTDEMTQALDWRGYTIKPPYVKFSWKPSTAPQGVRYYNIYRSDVKNFKPEYSNLIGSTSELFFIDMNLKKGVEYKYRLVAVDNWDNRSMPSTELSVDIN